MSKIVALLFGSIAVLAGMFFLMTGAPKSRPGSGPNSSEPTQALTFYCAASNRAVVEEIRQLYEAETGRQVQMQYGPSQTLLSSLEVSHSGDLYLPADDSFLETALGKGLVAEVLPIARMHAVIAVPKGNPKQLKTFQDLLREDVRLVQASVDAAAIGKLTREVLTRADLWKQLDQATEGYRTTVTDVANDLLVGAADAGIVYDAVLATYPDLEYFSIPELAEAHSQVSIGVLASAQRPSDALHFARYLTASDRGLVQYKKFGFQVASGDRWSDIPELTIFAGSMLRPAIEETIQQFENREGIRVSRNYNGCGILVAQMQGGQHPDAYFACDNEFMNQVVDLFPHPVPVSQNELVILVQKGNPHKIGSLKDLTRKGLRVGIGHEKQCAMGWITQNTFKEGGIQTEVMANVTVQTPTGDMLVNQLRAGSLDAAVAYLSNAAGAGDVLDAVQIQGIACSTATQPWGVATDSKYPETAGRLFAAICSTESQDMFASQGFRWQFAPKDMSLTSAPVSSTSLEKGVGQAAWTQDSHNSATDSNQSASFAGPLKIVKLLWKANPKSAAKTLAKTITTAADRNELPQLQNAFSSLRSETEAVVKSDDLNDPRYAAALAAKLLDEIDRPTGETIATAITELQSVDQRQLLWQVWLAVDPQAALKHFPESLTQPEKDELQIAWHSAMITAAIRAERKMAGQILIDHWQQLGPASQLAAIEPLTAAADSMQVLLHSVAEGSISKDLINTNQLRKWLASDNATLKAAIEEIWGRVRQEDNAARGELVAKTLQNIQQGAQGSASRGALIFDRVCSQCHVLHGRGYEVGPNIVGNGRGNLQQLISNVLDPSLVIGEAFQAKTVLTLDGEVVSGLVAAENDRYLTLKVQGGKTIEFEKAELEQIKSSTQSLMPEGVESQMQPQELFDLLAYLCLLKPLDATDNELIPGTPLDFVQP